MKTYGTLIEGIRIDRVGRNITILTPILDILLKLIIAVSVTRLINWPVFTIFVFNFAILFSTVFILYFSPIENKIEQLRASFNALTFLLLNYHLFLFTRYTDQSMYPTVANSVIWLIWGSIGINLLLVVPLRLLKVLLLIKDKFRSFKHKKNIGVKKQSSLPEKCEVVNIFQFEVD